MIDERCRNCHSVGECNIAVGYGSVVCTLNRMRSGQAKKDVLNVKEHNYDNCRNLTCRRKCEMDGYNKAIDDCKTYIGLHRLYAERSIDDYVNYLQMESWLNNKMAEQLKSRTEL